MTRSERVGICLLAAVSWFVSIGISFGQGKAEKIQDISEYISRGYKFYGGAAAQDLKYTGYTDRNDSTKTETATFYVGTIYLLNNNDIVVCSYKSFVKKDKDDKEPLFYDDDAPHTSSQCTAIK